MTITLGDTHFECKNLFSFIFTAKIEAYHKLRIYIKFPLLLEDFQYSKQRVTYMIGLRRNIVNLFLFIDCQHKI